LTKRGSFVGWVYLVSLICLFSVTFWGAVVTQRNSAKQERARAASNVGKLSPALSEANPADSRFGPLKGSRTLFPYSVIPGGVENAQELRNALEHDPIAAAHYAGFDPSQTHVERLASDEEMYVSYRLNNRIYWSRKRLKLLKGETVITDGKNVARTRCGNRLSETAQSPVAEKQPLDMTLDPSPLPDLAEARPIELPLALPFPVASSVLTPGSGGTIPPGIFPPVLGGSSSPHNSVTPPTTPTTPPIATPEPDSFVLTAAGISIVLASGWFGYFRRRIHA
jgi:hypothetical protein